MRSRRAVILPLLFLFAACLLACGGFASGLEGRVPAARASAGGGPLLFTIGVHVEPFGAEPSPRVPAEHARAGAAEMDRPPRGKAQGSRPNDYRERPFFSRHVADLEALLAVVERHGGKVVVQAQTPFTTVLAEAGDDIFRDAVARGHEAALHFHEDAHLGPDFAQVPASVWEAVLRDEVEALERAGAPRVRYMSGAILYPHLPTVAAAVGIDVIGDFKSRWLDATPRALLVGSPWRPRGGTDGRDVSAFSEHDPQGRVIYLPDGREDLVTEKRELQRRYGRAESLGPLLDAFERALRANAAQRDPERVNVFHLTIHPGEISGTDREHPYAQLDRWLGQVVDPLVKSGDVQWATFSEMADAFSAWEGARRGVPVRPEPGPAALAPAEADGPTVSFVVNVHDWKNPADSAATLLRLMDVFEKYGVHGDFYLTAPMVELYATSWPEVIERLRQGRHGIGYHTRAPHPLSSGFGRDLAGLPDALLRQALLDYETWHLDLATGTLDRSRPGGFTYVRDTLGTTPAVVGATNGDRRVQRAGFQVYASLGARVKVPDQHEGATNPSDPFRWEDGLLVRPSVIGLTRWSRGGRDEAFWWNAIQREPQAFDPLARLQEQLRGAQENGEPPSGIYVTSLIHENNFYREKETPWARVFYSEYGRGQRVPLDPPFDLAAPDDSLPRSAAAQARIWEAYERLVAWAAANATVATAAEIALRAAAAQGGTGDQPPP